MNLDIIKNYLKENKMSVKDFCGEVEISKYMYYKIINGSLDFDAGILLRIAKFMKIELCRFFK